MYRTESKTVRRRTLLVSPLVGFCSYFLPVECEDVPIAIRGRTEKSEDKCSAADVTDVDVAAHPLYSDEFGLKETPGGERVT